MIAADSFNALAHIFEARGSDTYIGELVTQEQHATQCAYFADIAGFDEATVIGALLHDIGHIMDPSLPQMEGKIGVKNHELLGADFLASLGFPKKTCELAKRHVDAKRYLCWKDQAYHSNLSEASKKTLLQQGGVMTEEEALYFESSDPLFKTIILMRTWDEKAKIVAPKFEIPPFCSYEAMVVRVLEREEERKRIEMKTFKNYTLSSTQREKWEKNGFLLFTDLLGPTLKKDIVTWCEEVQSLPPTKGKWMVYYEESNKTGKEILCRTENFLPYHEPIRALLTQESAITDVLEQLFGEEAILFKEKFNYKQSGGGAFPPHQDAPAFNSFGQKNHLSLSISIDPSTVENGCLQVAPGKHLQGLFPQASHGGLTEEEESKLSWDDVIMQPGDVLIFSSWLPHRSGPNTTDSARRVLYVTYNGKSDGSYREKYYAEKLEHFPQKVDRIAGRDYSQGAKTYNLATPITN